MSESLIKFKKNAKELENKPYAVIIAEAGIGKSSLISLLCENKKRKNFVDNDNLENYIYDMEKFILIDTPSVESKVNSYDTALLFRKLITNKEINTIFLITKYDTRWERIEDDIQQLVETVDKYKSKIVIMIAHWDLCKNPDNAFPEICELFQDFANIICYSIKDKKEQILNHMHSCVSNMNPEKLQIDDKELFITLNVNVNMSNNVGNSTYNYSNENKTEMNTQNYNESKPKKSNCVIS